MTIVVNPPAARNPDVSRRTVNWGVRLFDPLTGTIVRLPWMPDEIETANIAQAWEQVARPGRRPLMLARGKNLPTVSLPVRLVNPGQVGDVQGTIDTLGNLARSSNPLHLNVGAQFRGAWRITGLTVRETHWNADGKPVDADVTIELTASSDMVAPVGPVKRAIRGRLKGAAKRGRKKGARS